MAKHMVQSPNMNPRSEKYQTASTIAAAGALVLAVILARGNNNPTESAPTVSQNSLCHYEYFAWLNVTSSQEKQLVTGPKNLDKATKQFIGQIVHRPGSSIEVFFGPTTSHDQDKLNEFAATRLVELSGKTEASGDALIESQNGLATQNGATVLGLEKVGTNCDIIQPSLPFTMPGQFA